MPSRFIDYKAVRSAVSLEQVLGHYGILSKLKGKGPTRRGICPIHRGTHETQFSVNLEKGLWQCFSDCHCGGSTLEFVSKMESIDLQQAAHRVCQWFHIDPEAFNGAAPVASPTTDVSAEPEDASPNPPLGYVLKDLNPSHPYLASRQFRKTTLNKFGVGYCDHGPLAGTIAIPIRDIDGRMVAYASRFAGDPVEPDVPKYRFPTGFKKRLELWNAHEALFRSDAEPLFVVEGFFDAMRLWEHGPHRVVALMGSSLSEEQERLVVEHTTTRTRIVLMLDEDKAGRNARDEIAPRLARHRFVRIHRFAEEGRQPEHLTREEVATLLAELEGAL